jgi:hypothetical protein
MTTGNVIGGYKATLCAFRWLTPPHPCPLTRYS